jgi:hypothetical protein
MVGGPLIIQAQDIRTVAQQPGGIRYSRITGLDDRPDSLLIEEPTEL